MSARPRDLSQLAARMQEEQKAMRTLMQTLRRHVADVPELDRQDWLHGLRRGFDRLHAHLDQMFRTKADGGYLKELLDVRPTLSPQVERMQCEHDQMLQMAERLREDLGRMEPTAGLLIADACARVARFIAVVSQHQHREDTIALLVFNQDIGAGD
jgi:hemerythrin-like domain-containing protein